MNSGMSFQPFGERINLYSPLPPDECRRRLEAKFVPGWQRPNDLRPRGRFFGHLLLMWLGAFDWINRNSKPKLIVWLRAEESGTRITGRTVPGIQFVLTLIPLAAAGVWGSFALLTYQPVHSPADPATYIIIKMILALVTFGFVASIWWFAHAEGRAGKLLVNFLKQTLSVTDAAGPPPHASHGEE
ncbi:hypothetical protein MOK15_14830 [Sphingobium sp. BYY-5]|uniref:hypothetical protein n=1 Tax=Sphingobium sp. BYY-5 TaxID=2926400 RepID=UPI001FA728FB|nr:hypothetical protein [Sphingobium sp. BYY-5]MCI4591360.1 hypothetical protein [Sphingobium sp. BYY-5]